MTVANPYFVHGDKIAVSMAPQKRNGLPIKIDDESLYNEFGFLLPQDIDSFTIVRDLKNIKSPKCKTINVCGLLDRNGNLYDVIATPDPDVPQSRIVNVVLLPKTPHLIHRVFQGALEERIELAISMGYDTIEKLLTLLGKYTEIDVKYYKFFSIKEITKELIKRNTLSNPEKYFLIDNIE